MPDREAVPTDVATDGVYEWSDSSGPQTANVKGDRRRERRRSDWRLGGRSVREWDYRVVAAALLAFGLGVLLSGLAHRMGPPWLGAISLWACLSSAVVVAFLRARPAGLLRLKSIDLLWGTGAGFGLRLLQGTLSQANSSSFPVITQGSGLSPVDWGASAIGAATAGPVVEELFFRAVVLVSLFHLARRAMGHIAAGALALVASSGAFLLVHAVLGSLALVDATQLFIVGAVCALLVLLTGRVWSAVIAHVVYNVTFVTLAAAGTLLS